MTLTARGWAIALLLAWPGQPLDDGVRAWVQSHRAPWLDGPMHVASNQSRVVLLAGGALALFAGTAGRAFVLETVLALAPVNVVVETLKWCVNRTRPDGSRDRKNSSFPSSHAANAFAVAVVITRRWRRAAIPAWLAAFTVSYSRLYLDRHWFSDVAFAAIVALGGGFLAALAVKRLRKPTRAAAAA